MNKVVSHQQEQAQQQHVEMTLLLQPRLDHRRYSSPHTLTTATLHTQKSQRFDVPGAFPSPVSEEAGTRTPTGTAAHALGYVPRQHTLHPSAARNPPPPPPAAAAQDYFPEPYIAIQRRSASVIQESTYNSEASSSRSHSPCPSSPRVRALEPPHLPTLYELRSSSSTSRRAASEASSPPPLQRSFHTSPARSSTDPSRDLAASPPRGGESLRERMLSSLGLGGASSAGGTAVDIPAPATRNVARSMDGHHARRASVDASGAVAADPRSVSSSSMGSAQKAFGALIAGQREASAVTPRPHDVSATPRPGAVQAAAAANAAANAQMEANRGVASEHSWRSWVRGARATGREASDATLHDRRVSVLTSDDEGILREEPDVDYAAMSAANGQRYAKDSFGRNSTASTGAASYLPMSEDGRSRHGECNDAALRRERRKKRHAPPELLVIVRPPPTKQGNPLNLQIQLVTPVAPPALTSSARNSTAGDMSMDDGANGNVSMSSSGSGLRRSGSITSNRSMRSEVSSGGVSTTSSSGAGGRRVTPLYNLSFHAILATTVTDAGTDQKVAKFGRKGVEIDGFGHLEPRELVHGVNDLRSILTNGSSPGGPLSTGGSDLSPPRGGSDVGVKADLAPTEEPPTSYGAMTAEAKSDSIGGKLLNKFKRLSLQARPSTASGIVSTPASASPLGRFQLGGGNNANAAAGHSKRASIDFGSSALADSLLGGSHSGSDIPQLTPAGGLSAEGTRRTDGYVWTVRRFTRRANDDEAAQSTQLVGPDGQNAVLANVWRRFNMHNRAGAEVRHPPASEIPIRFEWTKDRERARRFRARSRRTSAVSHARSATDSATSGGGGGPRVVAAQRGSFDISAAGASTPNKALRPPSVAGSRPSSVHAERTPRRSRDGGSALDDTGSSVAADDDALGDVDDEDDAGSDPEDSETPWSCHLVLGPETRIPIGSLSPAPYHPKLVGQLAVPFPLPDLSASGLGADAAGLTREELKDIVNVTCLFLVIREGWGGLAKNKRKA